MADLRGFDAYEVEPAKKLDVITPGKYLAVITESEMKPNRTGTGEYLQLTFQIIEGPFRGRVLWTRLNLRHPNATAVQIARAQLSAICRAVGVLTPQDSAELHNLPLVIDVRCRKRPDTGQLVNEIKGYSPKTTLTKNSQNPLAAQLPARNDRTTPPWK